MAKSNAVVESGAVVESSEVAESGAAMPDATSGAVVESLKSFSTTATLLEYDTENKTYRVISEMASPTCRGSDFVDACRNLAASLTYTDRIIGNETRYVQLTLARYDTIEIRLHVMIKRSGSQCEVCGNIKSDFANDRHTYDWCNAENGCGSWKYETDKPRDRSRIDVDAAASVF